MKFRFLFLVINLILCLGIYTHATMQSSPEVTQSLEPSRSLFENDTCTPPCWFGLTPGESTAENIQAMFRENASIFEVRRLLDDGNIVFTWKHINRTDNYAPESFMMVEDNRLSGIIVTMNRMVSLEETLNTLGYPAKVSIYPGFYTWNFFLIYPNNTAVALQTDRENCQISDIKNEFTITSVYYYLHHESQFLSSWSMANYYIDVPNQVWNLWLSDKIKDSCENVFGKFFSSPQVVATENALETQVVGTNDASQATRNAHALATVTAHFSADVTATATPH